MNSSQWRTHRRLPGWALALVTVAGCATDSPAPRAVYSASAVAAARSRFAPAAEPKAALSPASDTACLTDRPPPTVPVARSTFGEQPSAWLAGDPASRPASAPVVTVERGPLPDLRATIARDLREAPSLLWHDTKKVYGDPWNLVFLVGAGGASLALRPEVDDDIDDHYVGHDTFSNDWNDAFGAAGNPATHFALAGLWYLAGQQAQDAKTYEVGKRMFSALAITGVSTMFFKVAACTDSPNGESLAWPSGHVSSTMAMATVLNDAYGPLVGAPMFALTALVGVSRIDDQEHSFSDVVFGAALGWVVAHSVMKEHRLEVFGGEIVPYVDPQSGQAGIAWLKTLGN